MRSIFIGLCALVLLAITPSVKADPVVITSGQLTVVGLAGQPSYIINGLNFSVTASGGDTGNTPGCVPCIGGTLFSMSSFLVGTSLGSGSATINGTTFNNIGFLGEFTLAAVSGILPTVQQNVSISTPFQFTGNIRGCLPSNVVCTTEVFSTTQLTGGGIATAQFAFAGLLNGVPQYTFTSITYEFQEIPEPMTILLLTSGLIGLGTRFRSRQRLR